MDKMFQEKTRKDVEVGNRKFGKDGMLHHALIRNPHYLRVSRKRHIIPL